MNVLCRGCRSEIDLNASMCPICTRPRDRSEMLEDAKRMREAQAEAKARPFKLVGALAAAAAAGWALWTLRGPIASGLAAVRGKAGSVMDQASDPRTYAPAKPPVDAPSPVASAPAAPGGAAKPSAAAAGPSAPAAPAAPAPLAPVDWTPKPPALSVTEGQIILRGWVYDAITARPVPGATIRLRDRVSGEVMGFSADSSGWYEVALNRENSGLTPEAAAAGYKRETLAENEPPWHARKPAARRRAAAAPPEEVMLTFTPRQEEAEINIVLIPAKP